MNNWGDKLLGFGLMRLPKEGEEISIPRVCEMVDAFMEKGFTYFDTAWLYCGLISERNLHPVQHCEFFQDRQQTPESNHNDSQKARIPAKTVL